MSKKNDSQEIHDHSDLRKWRVEIPNLYDDADLTVYEFRLLVHYKRVGNCFEGIRKTAEKCHMSEGQVVQARRTLAEKFCIGKKKFIRIAPQLSDMGTTRIEVTDVWAENFAHFSKRSQSERAHGVSTRVHTVSTRAHRVSTRAHRVSKPTNPLRTKPSKKQPPQEGARAARVVVEVAPLSQYYFSTLTQSLGIAQENAERLEKLPHLTPCYLDAWIEYARQNRQDARDDQKRILRGGYFYARMRDKRLPPEIDGSSVFFAKWKREQAERLAE